MASSSPVLWFLPIALLVVASVLSAGCATGSGVVLTETAIIRRPAGFHDARPTDEVPSTRATAEVGLAATEVAALRLESAHRRATIEMADDATSSATGGFICQVDMGIAPVDGPS